ncbi:ornithine carbamoyltransferase [Alkalibaculum sp. M08DMB]|uniref:Ornithine carbamoyltransferase n=1 Tax=Alkalibaculum sporogenes TaxID=2655001 RepID=A0A6A7KD53_9FIRM|nr:ornithine carbamoyltransferase [Alkalibaculum sporogenes]MPW27261.1 ornithine carbamoyltransferase [Alkalibaculum sporogenes]
MPINLKGRSLLTLKDYTQEEINYLLELSISLKSKKIIGIQDNLLLGKNIVLIFEKTSTRTRCAFEVAAFDEGAKVTFLTNSQMGKKESIEDTAKVLGRFYDGIEFRGFKQETVEQLSKFSGIPVWNGLTDMYHPTQVLADFMTIKEQINKPLKDIKFVYMGDARNNVANSLMIGAAKIGMDFVAVAPKELFPDSDFIDEIKSISLANGGTIQVTENIEQGVKNADVLYTDVWISMGEEDKAKERIEMLLPYQVTMDTIRSTENKDVIFLHCLPAFHDLNTEFAQKIYNQYGLKEMEVTDEVFRSSHSKVFDEAENRMHTIKAVMVATL